MIFVGVWSFFPPPTWITENEHGWQVFHWASIAATFIGWYVVSMTPRLPPTHSTRIIDGTSTTSDVLADRANGESGSRRRCHAETPSMIVEPTTSDARITCA